MMAFEDFWRNVVGAAMVRRDGMLPPDVPRLTREIVRKELARDSRWLKPWTVAGFASSDLSFLPKAEQREFEEKVGKFQSLAQLAADRNLWTRELHEMKTDANKVLDYAKSAQERTIQKTQQCDLSDQELEQIEPRLAEIAAPVFEAIIMRLQLDRFRDAEAFLLGRQIEERLRAEGWPEELVELRIKTGDNYRGEPSIWLWAILKDGVTDNNDNYKTVAGKLDAALFRISRTIAPDFYPYIAYRSVSEPLLEVAER